MFGSVARGEADEWSDLDLIVIADTDAEMFTDSQAEDAVNRAGVGLTLSHHAARL